MKKIIILLVLTLVTSSVVQAQDIPDHAIGIRLASSVTGDEGFGPEITYQKQMFSDHNRLDMNVSYRTNSWRNTLRAGAYFHWTYNIVDNLNWFAGPGAGIGYIDFDNGFSTNFVGFTTVNERDNTVFGYIGGDFGVDYRFDFPLQVAFSIRPSFDIHDVDNRAGFNDVDNVNVNVGISARYTF